MNQPNNQTQQVEEQPKTFDVSSYWKNLPANLKVVLIILAVIVVIAVGFLVYLITKSLFAGIISSLTSIGAFFGIKQKQKQKKTDREKLLVDAEQKLVQQENKNLDENSQKQVKDVQVELKHTLDQQKNKQASEDARIDSDVRSLSPEEVKEQILKLATKKDEFDG